jgi:asparagine synthase (glutamine-hydrolysing)
LDSTALVALIRHLRPEVKISTYTIGFGPDDPEIAGARRTADHFKTQHHEVFFENSELERLLPRYVWLTEDLVGCGEAVLQQKVIEHIDPGTRMLFAGHGADSTFTGMPRHRLMWLARHFPPPVSGGLGELLKYSQTREMPVSWLGRRLTQRAYGEAPHRALQVIGAHPLTMPDARLNLCNYMRTSWNAMNTFQYHEPAEDCAGLICATPFIEAEVRDLAQATPISHMITARYQKKILRDALSGLLPDSLRKRPKAIQRLRRDRSLSEALLATAKKFDVRDKLVERGLIATGDIDRVLRSPADRLSDTALADLWTLVCAEIWMQTFSDGRGRVPLGQPLSAPKIVSIQAQSPIRAKTRVA